MVGSIRFLSPVACRVVSALNQGCGRKGQERTSGGALLLGPDFGFEGAQAYVFSAPRAPRKPGLVTQAVQERLPVPALLDGHLRKKQAQRGLGVQKEAVGTDDHLFRSDRPWSRESADLEPESRKLVAGHGGEAGIVQRRGHRDVTYALGE
jgi:hypothetical protein